MPTNTARALRVVADAPDPIDAERRADIASYRRDLAGEGLALRTAEIYGDTAGWLCDWLARTHNPRGFAHVTARDLNAFLTAYETGEDGYNPHAKSTVNQAYRALRNFGAWLAREDVYGRADPMVGVRKRSAGEFNAQGKVLRDAQVDAIFGTVLKGRDFTSVRDYAILQLFYANGIRREEMARLTVPEVDLDARTITVWGKGKGGGPRPRTLHISPEVVAALDRYLRMRRRHPLADQPELWLGRRGVLTGRGIHRIVVKRGQQAGVANLYPHKFRHTFAHRWLTVDGSQHGLEKNMGWNGGEMVRRYAAETAAERARAEAARMHLGYRPGGKR